MKIKSIIAVLLTTISINTAFAQNERKISVEELFTLTKENHPNLSVSKADIAIAKQKVEVAKHYHWCSGILFRRCKYHRQGFF